MPLAVDLKHKKIYNAKRVGQQQCLPLFVAFSFTRLSCVNRNLLGTDKSVNKDLFCGILYRKRLYITLGDILVDEAAVPNEFFISDEDFPKWEYQKGSKSLKRINKTTGFEYNYSEGAMAFPDYLDRASRTIITGEGGAGPSRFKHIIRTKSGRYRRLVPVELERLNMFPDNHTFGSSDLRRAFLMGNALVTGIVENIALVLKERM